MGVILVSWIVLLLIGVLVVCLVVWWWRIPVVFLWEFLREEGEEDWKSSRSIFSREEKENE